MRADGEALSPGCRKILIVGFLAAGDRLAAAGVDSGVGSRTVAQLTGQKTVRWPRGERIWLCIFSRRRRKFDIAGMAKLADALDLGSSAERRGGSNPPPRTNKSF